jgi:2-aminobenzoate-CoA ligase
MGASTVLLEKGARTTCWTPSATRPHVLFTAPTSYRAMAAPAPSRCAQPLRKCVSAGEALPAATRALWKQATGIEIIDGIGATETAAHLHLGRRGAGPARRHRQGRCRATAPAWSTTRASRCRRAGGPAGGEGPHRLPLPGRRAPGQLRAERLEPTPATPTSLDADGYFVYQARTDDMIISAGYNIAGPEVEDALLRTRRWPSAA